jgi:polysaccharide export outer membrane protein
MKAVNSIKNTILVLSVGIFIPLSISAQEVVLKQRKRVSQPDTTIAKSDDGKNQKVTSPVLNNEPVTSVKADDEEVEAVTKYYVNYLSEYRLGPEDVISVQVFGQCPDYCDPEITVPPTALISYPLIREGIFVGGKTIDQVTDEITKKLDEFIIEPKVTISLKKVGSARYSVVGKVENQGMRLMTRKVSIFDAIAESGGISKDGDKKHAVILRPNTENRLVPIMVDLKAIEEGKADMAYLNPGDQVVVPKEGFNINTLLDSLGKFSLLRILLPF